MVGMSLALLLGQQKRWQIALVITVPRRVVKRALFTAQALITDQLHCHGVAATFLKN